MVALRRSNDQLCCGKLDFTLSLLTSEPAVTTIHYVTSHHITLHRVMFCYVTLHCITLHHPPVLTVWLSLYQALWLSVWCVVLCSWWQPTPMGRRWFTPALLQTCGPWVCWPMRCSLGKLPTGSAQDAAGINLCHLSCAPSSSPASFVQGAADTHPDADGCLATHLLDAD